jgi:hypothetical protein
LSPLTKVFVVLLVILSMLLSAATIVFVNARDADRDAQRRLAEQNAQQMRRAQQQESEAQAARQISEDNLRNAMQQNEQLKQQLNNLQAQLVDRATQLGQAQSELAMRAADITRLTEALKASQATASNLHGQVTELRQVNDARLQDNTELNQRVSDLTNRLEVTERERRNLAEQLTEARARADQMGMQLRSVGLSPDQLAAAGSRLGPPISGVVREVRPIQGVPYATISIGSNDGVRRGMEFRVVSERTGDFLGLLTVESVEMTEATGRLQGPRLGDVRPGAEVRTQTGA